MTTAEAPDPRTLESWEQAFRYPVVTVRGMEKKLRGSLTENQDKLRTLVGASYRDLLGTARTIIDIDTQLHQVECLIADAGRKADSRNFDKLGRNVSRAEAQWTQQEHSQLSLASETTSLKSCLATVAKLLRSRGSTLLAAKLLVLAYLLQTSLSKRSDQKHEIHHYSARLESLKQRLLRHVDRRLAVTNASIDSLVEDLTAFSFATRASPLDTLRHFHHVRAKALRAERDKAETDTEAQVKKRLGLFLSTVSASRSIFPDVLSAALRSLANRNLLSDVSILAIDSLRLDVHSRWFDPEIRNFTPWTRHDELLGVDAERALKSWAGNATGVLPSTIEQDLTAESDPAMLSSVRRNVLQSWLSNRRTARGAASRAVLSQLQAPFLRRFETLTKDAAADLQESVAASIVDCIETWDSQSSETILPSLWDSSTIPVDASDGGLSFRLALVARRHGSTDNVSAVMTIFEKASSKITSVYDAVKAMREIRWDDDYDDDFDNSDEEDADDSILQSLSRKDPDALETLVLESTSASLASLQSRLEETDTLADLDASSPSSPGVYVLRALRALRLRITQLQSSLNPKAPPKAPFCSRLFESTQKSLARAVDDGSSARLNAAMHRFTSRPTRIRALWDGRPEIPVQPAPWAFAYLRALVKKMADIGPDLWSSDAVDALKSLAAQRAAKRIEQCIGEVEVPVQSLPTAEKSSVEDPDAGQSEQSRPDQMAADGNASAEPSEKPDDELPSQEKDTEHLRKDLYLQLLFDVLYLHTAFGKTGGTAAKAPDDEAGSMLSRVAQQLITESGVDTAMTERITKAARDYWRRTYLLFGLLAN